MNAPLFYKVFAALLDALEKERIRSAKLVKQVITAQEEERKRIARELHDETSLILASLSLGLEQLKATIPLAGASDAANYKQHINHLKAMTDKTLIELHRLTFNLRPSLLDEMGLKSALTWLLREQLEAKGLGVEFVWKIGWDRLPEEDEISIFRIIQEAVTNIIKHAKASQVTVSLEEKKGGVRITIADNGVGFAFKEQASTGTFGLIGMKERVTLLQGEFELKSAPGKGTGIAVSFPLKQVEPGSSGSD